MHTHHFVIGLPNYSYVLGPGRSGTGYMAALLTEAGIPCGHEYMGERATANWTASAIAPVLVEYNKIVHVVRDPLATLGSQLAFNWGADRHDPLYELLSRFAPDFSLYTTQQGRLVAAWVGLNTFLLGLRGHSNYFLHRVEDSPKAMLQWLDAPKPDTIIVQQDINHQDDRVRPALDPRKIPPGLWHRFLQLRNHLGYG